MAQLPMYWFIMAPYKSPPFGCCAIYFHNSVVLTQDQFEHFSAQGIAKKNVEKTHTFIKTQKHDGAFCLKPGGLFFSLSLPCFLLLKGPKSLKKKVP